MRFAGFIITYERPQILKETISQLFGQSLPLEKILIIDNSENNETKLLIDELTDSRLEYHRMGYNAGPAGAAKMGLEKLAAAGFDWIYWGDDDDPPPFPDTFSSLFEILNTHPNPEVIGQLGMVGHYFNRKSGKIIRVTDNELLNSSYLSVDTIAGGQVKIVSRAVIEANALPSPELFFGFEELDFDLKTKKSGFEIVVSSSDFIRVRKKYNRMSLKETSYTVKSNRGLIRQYYSTRNMIFILKSNHLYSGYLNQALKSFIKSMYGFRYGLSYGRNNFQMVMLGLLHGIIQKGGKRF